VGWKRTGRLCDTEDVAEGVVEGLVATVWLGSVECGAVIGCACGSPELSQAASSRVAMAAMNSRRTCSTLPARSAQANVAGVPAPNDAPITARRTPARASERAYRAEVAAHVEAYTDQLDPDGHRLVVRNGYHQPREVSTAAGAVPVLRPRVNDKRIDEMTGQRRRFSSAILPA
jgi:hypothetical protein